MIVFETKNQPPPDQNNAQAYVRQLSFESATMTTSSPTRFRLNTCISLSLTRLLSAPESDQAFTQHGGGCINFLKPGPCIELNEAGSTDAFQQLIQAICQTNDATWWLNAQAMAACHMLLSFAPTKHPLPLLVTTPTCTACSVYCKSNDTQQRHAKA